MIVVCGEALIDWTPARCGKEMGYVPRPGGSPYNVAVALARLNIPSAFLGRVSEDLFGELLTRHLASNGVDLRYVRRGPEPTTLAFVQLEPGEEPRFAFYGEDSADRKLLPEDVPASFPEDVRAVHVGLGSITLLVDPAASTLEACMRREREARVISLDPNVRPALIADRRGYAARLEEWIRLTDIARASRADVAWLYPDREADEVAQRWLDLGARLVVVSLGEEGAVGIGPRVTVRVPAVPVEIVDAVGAGDSFMAGLLATLYRNDLLERDALEQLGSADLARALEYAARVAALTCTRAGADPPSRREVEASATSG
jgi:fructokinase